MTSSTTTYVIVSNRPWNRALPDRLNELYSGQFLLIDHKDQLTLEYIKSLAPRRIFFPHWSYKIPSSIYKNFECVIFHLTDVPYGRGGSPLQNLIVRGHTETVISALQCVEELDAGPVYLKRPLSLYGTAEEIYLRASDVIQEMIVNIIDNDPEPTPQQGEIVVFQRRQPEDGNLEQSQCLDTVYDLIRMLDAEGYPPAFIELGEFRMEFKRAARHADGIHADVIIKKRKRDAI